MGKNFLLATAENDKREYYPMFEITFGRALHFPLFLNLGQYLHVHLL